MERLTLTEKELRPSGKADELVTIEVEHLPEQVADRCLPYIDNGLHGWITAKASLVVRAKRAIIHESLPVDDVSRLRRAYDALADVTYRPWNDWLDDARKNSNPRPEIDLWEAIAIVYQEAIRNENRRTKRIAVKDFLVQVSFFGSEQACRLRDSMISRREAEKLAARFLDEFSKLGAEWRPGAVFGNRAN